MRPIQNLRKAHGLEVTDRIDTVIYAEGQALEDIEASLKNFKDYVCTQTLSRSLALKPLAEAGADADRVEWGDQDIAIKITN